MSGRCVEGSRCGYDAGMDAAGLIVIGSGPGGVSAADAFRQHDRDLPVCILSADPEPPYARPPLSKDYLRGDTDDVWLHPADWYAERRIDLRLATEVVAIDPSAHTVTAGGTVHSYTSLVLACGSAPTPLPVPGGQHALQLRSLADAARLRKAASERHRRWSWGGVHRMRSGCLPCAQRTGRHAGRSRPRCRRRSGSALPPDGASERLVESSGARYVGGASVRELDDGVVRLDDGVSDRLRPHRRRDRSRHPAASSPRQAGLEIRDSRVVVGADMRTSAPDVYAVGDVALAFNAGAGRHIAVEHWQDADDQGAIAGEVAAGQSSRWQAVPGFWTTIGEATVKYHAWGDGYDRDRLIERGDGFTVWYESDGSTVGVLTHDADDDTRPAKPSSPGHDRRRYR